MSFKKITEETSLYSDLEYESVEEFSQDIDTKDQKVALAIQKTISQIAKLVKLTTPRMKQGGRIFYMGAGTSDHLGVLNVPELPPTFGVLEALIIGLIAGGNTVLHNAVEAAEDDEKHGWNELAEHNINSNDTAIGIVASGTAPCVVGALRDARGHDILTACITNGSDSPMAVRSDTAIEMIVGPEYTTGSSRVKSDMGQKMILSMINTAAVIQLERVRGNETVNMQLTNQRLVDHGTCILIDLLGLGYGKAKSPLLLHGSVEKVLRGTKLPTKDE